MKNFYLNHKFTVNYFTGMAILIGLLAWFLVWGENKDCMSKWSDYQAQWGFWSGCRIKYNDRMTPTSMIKNIFLTQ